MADETTEPAIPVIAPLPVGAYASLLDLAKREWPQLQQPGARVAFDITARKDASVLAVVSVHEVDVGAVVRREFTGAWSAGGFLQWTPGRRR